MFYRDGEVPQMTTSPQSTSPGIWEDLASGTGPQYRSFLHLSRKNRTSSPLQVLNFRGLKAVPKTKVFREEVHFFGKSVQICAQITNCTSKKLYLRRSALFWEEVHFFVNIIFFRRNQLFPRFRRHRFLKENIPCHSGGKN